MTGRAPTEARRVRVLIACPGLGIARRGFERVARDMFDELRDHPELEVWLAKGRGPRAPREVRAWTIGRDARVPRAIGVRLRRDPGWHEQRLFAIALQPQIARIRPDVVLLSEWTLARALGISRRVARQRFRILLANGVGRTPPYPPGVDHVQQVTPGAAAAAAAHPDALPQTLLPHAVRIEPGFEPPTQSKKRALRSSLGIPAERRVMLSVGALNRTKRVDYLLEEVASLTDPPFLVLLGNFDPETPELLALARSLLGADGFVARSVSERSVADHYRAADCFALASRAEGFGLALVDALAHGLPVIAHDFAVARFVVGEHGYLADLGIRGALAGAYASLGPGDAAESLGRERHASVYERFSWDVLAPGYVRLFREVAGHEDGAAP